MMASASTQAAPASKPAVLNLAESEDEEQNPPPAKRQKAHYPQPEPEPAAEQLPAPRLLAGFSYLRTESIAPEANQYALPLRQHPLRTSSAQAGPCAGACWASRCPACSWTTWTPSSASTSVRDSSAVPQSCLQQRLTRCRVQ